MSAIHAERVPRGREEFFLAAYDLLAAEGYGAVNVAALCDRVGVTKGSFYHHFADLPAFVEAFAARWQAWVEAVLEDLRAEPEPMRRMESTLNNFLALVTGAEPAIRAWARSEPALARALRVADAKALDMARYNAASFVGDAATGDLLARMIHATVVGRMQRPTAMDVERWVRNVAEWSRRCLHLEVAEIRQGDRLCVKVLGSNGRPVPHVRRPAALPSTEVESKAAFDAAVQSAVELLTPSADRGREAYFRAARELLVERGPAGITVAALSERVGLTKGSFHHHFGTMPRFVAAMAAEWERAYEQLITTYFAPASLAARWAAIFQALMALPRPAEAAWRAWAWTEPVVAASLRRVEEYGERLSRDMLVEQGEDPDTAEVLADLAVSVAAGMQLIVPAYDAETFALLSLESLRRCVGLDADLVMVDGVPCLTVRQAG